MFGRLAFLIGGNMAISPRVAKADCSFASTRPREARRDDAGDRAGVEAGR
jgi:hypothetical protein